ncbi:hypothetical protein BCR34DRAFT_589086 [Clohesyomyces aquaticus]|uniref:Uncharacterized protein n=1 Tax=Clohesyomyces aquaticus TaxID=1231657 RepID=A0A1Y1ZHK7_9PLEO|nr:hypothetical protein BCR34DRAFT_589086 [Clohesyomyces aquaticus]
MNAKLASYFAHVPRLFLKHRGINPGYQRGAIRPDLCLTTSHRPHSPNFQRHILLFVSSTFNMWNAFGDTTEKPHWVAAPKERGTNGIFIPCIMTLLICCYLGIIPAPGGALSRKDDERSTQGFVDR